MGKRGRPRKGNSKGQSLSESVSSPQHPSAERITRYFASSPEMGQKKPATPVAAKEQGTETANNIQNKGLPSGLLTPDNTPTKDSSKLRGVPEDPSSDRTLPYPQEHDGRDPDLHDAPITTPNGIDTAASADEKHQEAGMGNVLPDIRRVKPAEDKPTPGKVTAARSLQGKLDGAASTKKSRRRRNRKRGTAGAKTGDLQSPTVPRAKEDTTMRTMKDFFPVRRSDRRCKSMLEAEKKIELEEAILSNREVGLEVRDILGKGRGVVSTRRFRRGEFVVEYAGDLISMTEARDREREYKRDPGVGCYMYFFEHRNKKYCIDATRESGRLGRLLNHSRQGNCCTKLVHIGDRPYLILVARQDIDAGEELLYDYGDRNRETLESHPWLAL